MAYSGYIVSLKDVEPLVNSDNLSVVKIFGTQCLVSRNYYVGQRCVFFPESGQLSEEFCRVNDLVRRKDENGNPAGGYLDPDKRNVKTIRLRKEVSEGLLLPIESLASFGDITTLKDGDTIDIFNGVEICRKYIPRSNRRQSNSAGSNGRQNHQHKESGIKYNFPQHIDTPQLRFCLNKFENGDLITITEKLEGTSGRSAMLPVRHKNNWFRRMFHLPEKVTYRDFCGTRRVTIAGEEEVEVKPGYYGTHDFRMAFHELLKPHLRKNLEVFYEIVGWTGPDGVPIMGEVSTACLKDKAFTKKYGENMIFHYGCDEGKWDCYIYRIAELNDDSEVEVEYSTDQIRSWCELHNFKMVPILWRGVISSVEEVEELAKTYCDGESTLAPHWREGCVIRRENNAWKYDVFKHKNDYYRIIKGMFVENVDTSTVDESVLEEL